MEHTDQVVTAPMPIATVQNTQRYVPDSPSWFILFTTAFTAAWGLWFLLPWDTFTSSQTFAVMHVMAPEWIWGLGFFIAGSVKLFCKWHFLRTRVMRMGEVITNFVLFFLWVMVATSIVSAGATSTGTLTYSYFAILALWTWIESIITRGSQKRLREALNG